jgi:hypothetical protein
VEVPHGGAAQDDRSHQHLHRLVHIADLAEDCLAFLAVLEVPFDRVPLSFGQRVAHVFADAKTRPLALLGVGQPDVLLQVRLAQPLLGADGAR